MPAHAACTAPQPPDLAAKPTKPKPPERSACAEAKPGASGCLGWEAYAYNDAVKAYNVQASAFASAANAYVARLNAYVQAANDYARCEAQSLN
ncbi:MAG: hypothetical protein JO048_00805 [Methylobacteriaceae bacterium]|nr:hypothetical protein [Methylobacteriaceae bacterium]